MKALAPERRPAKPEYTTEDVRQALLRARRAAVKLARLHKVPLVYLEKGRVVRRVP